MTCFTPIKAWTAPGFTKNGKRNIVFKAKEAINPHDVFSLPCGQCIGCRLDRSRRAATQISLENLMHDKSIFITLTYDDEHVPYIVHQDTGEMLMTLKPEHMTLFMKRLRRSVAYHYPDNDKLRFYLCGEYGEKSGRPHYHVILFGFSPPDKVLYKTTFRGDKLYNSEFLSKCWSYGFVNFGNVTFESAAYVARYVCKKITGDMSEEHYKGRCPEFVRMSNRPGIGASWLEKYKDDVYPHDYVIIRDGVKVRPPKYFDTLYERWFPDKFSVIKEKRSFDNKKRIHNELVQRDIKIPTVEHGFLSELEQIFFEYEVLPIKEEITKSKLKRLKRNLEGDVF